MDTPSSMRRGTKSQTCSLSQKNNQDVASLRSKNNTNQERPVLQDISNDSPIIGIAAEKTPLSSMAKFVPLPKKTPGSGEALLRGQVKILLEKVEEGAEIVSKTSNRQCAPSFPCLGLLPISPGLLAAPTPANTPQIFDIARVKGNVGEEVLMEDVQTVLPKVAESVKHEDSSEQYRVCVLNRALLFDSPDKSEASTEAYSAVSSAITYQGSTICSSYDDNWSIQANASAYTEDEEDGLEEFNDDSLEEEEYDSQEEYGSQEEEEDGGEEKGEYLDELCEGLRKITVEEKETKLPEFTGKHTRFIYNSDDEIEREEEIGVAKARSPTVLLLKGLPAPEGKHLRFHEEDDEE